MGQISEAWTNLAPPGVDELQLGRTPDASSELLECAERWHTRVA